MARIGIIGVGGVGGYAHLPAYAARGLEVAAICDLDAATARKLATRFGVEEVHETAEQLIADPTIDIVDIATPPASHVDLVEACVRHGKRGALVQKPMVLDHASLERIHALRGTHIRLNTTGRWVSAWAHVRSVLARGEIGAPRLCTMMNRDWWDREPGRWEHTIDDFIVHEMTLHHLDLCLDWFGMPRRVTARGGTNANQAIARTNHVSAMLEYASGLVVDIIDDWGMCEFSFATGHPFETVTISGDDGAISGHSERIQVARRGEPRIDVRSLPRPGQTLPGPVLETAWFPDSFGAAMAAFIADLGDPDVVQRDRNHFHDLTSLTLAVAAATRASEWVSIGAPACDR